MGLVWRAELATVSEHLLLEILEFNWRLLTVHWYVLPRKKRGATWCVSCRTLSKARFGEPFAASLAAHRVPSLRGCVLSPLGNLVRQGYVSDCHAFLCFTFTL